MQHLTQQKPFGGKEDHADECRAEALGLREGMEVWVSLQAKAVHLIRR